jgi:stearoyl-CoA desaturase (Delta-9 desaturase)
MNTSVISQGSEEKMGVLHREHSMLPMEIVQSGAAKPIAVAPDSKYHYLRSIPFFLIHLAVLGIFFVPFHWYWPVLAVAFYAIRMVIVTAGYHRYFSHRSYKLNRFWQFVMAFAAQSSGQKGVLWWAANHRHHHRYSDQAEDIHSPIWKGIWYSHVGWILSKEYEEYDARSVQDFGKYPELRWLNKYHWVPIATLGTAIALLGGVGAFFWVFVLSTVMLYHGSFCINSLAHIWGWRRFETPDRSRNNFILALITMGEGWHNNHHQYMYSCRQGMRWWEVDITFYSLKVLNWLGIVRQIRGHQLPSTINKDALPS